METIPDIYIVRKKTSRRKKFTVTRLPKTTDLIWSYSIFCRFMGCRWYSSFFGIVSLSFKICPSSVYWHPTIGVGVSGSGLGYITRAREIGRWPRLKYSPILVPMFVHKYSELQAEEIILRIREDLWDIKLFTKMWKTRVLPFFYDRIPRILARKQGLISDSNLFIFLIIKLES